MRGFQTKKTSAENEDFYWPFECGASDVVLCVACFGDSFCTVFTFYLSRRYLVRFRQLGGHILGKSCSFG